MIARSSKRIVPRQLRTKVERELESGERIQWIDMPIARYFTPGATIAFLFAIPWTTFAIFWMVGSWHQAGNIIFTLFGLPFVLIGIGLLCAPLWARRKAFKTVYVITDRRAITFDGGWSTTIRSYTPDKLGNLYRNEKSDGTGDVVLAREAWRDSDGDKQSEEYGFISIENPKEIEAKLKELAKLAS